MYVIVENRGISIRLRPGVLVIGRAHDCDIVIDDDSLSRRQLAIEVGDKAISFRALSESPSVVLNGKASGGARLSSGDRLVTGKATLIISEKPPLRLLEPDVREARDINWKPFSAFIESLRSAVDPKILLERLLSGLVDLFRARRGFVLLGDIKSSGRLVPVASHRIDDDEKDDLIAVSSTIYKKALETGKPVFVSNSLTDALCANAGSLVSAGKATSIFCAPLIGKSKTFGVIYVDRPAGGMKYGRNSLEAFSSVVGLASELLGADETRRSLMVEQERVQALSRLISREEEFIVGESPAAKELERLLELAAPRDISVLITGETGTGKEMVARAIHERSARGHGPFIPVNCAALPSDLIECELFGAEKGAYTGSDRLRLGKFELASGGTLFLDEVGELPLSIQVKLLRILQERAVCRLGGQIPVKMDFRLITATNVDLEKAVAKGLFRQDLYFRINVFRVAIKPLRERVEDIMPLARHFLAVFSSRFKREIKDFSPEAHDLMMNHPWMGNIRELRNAIERAVVVETDEFVSPQSLPMFAGAQMGAAKDSTFWTKLPYSYSEAQEAFLRAFLTRSIKRHGGNISAVAKATGMPRRTIYTRIKQLGIDTRKL